MAVLNYQAGCDQLISWQRNNLCTYNSYVSVFLTDDESGRISGDPSETSSVAYSMDGEEDWIWGGEGPGYVDVQEIRAQLAFSGSLPALREIRLAVILSRKVHLKITNLLATSDACGAFIYNSVWIREPFIFRRLIPTYFSKHTLFAASFFLNAKDRKTASVECSEVGVGRGWSNAFLFPHSLVFLFFSLVSSSSVWILPISV